VTGRWMFPLNDGPTSKSEAELKCRRWHRLQPTISENPMNENPCPCSLFQAWRDRRFRWDWDYHYNYAPAGVECRLLLRFFRINRLLQATDPKTNDNFNAVWSQRCCYSYQFNDFGSLMEGPRYGGHLHLTNNPRINGFLTDEEAHQACCVESNHCELFYKKRPSDNCKGYRPPRRSKCNSLISLVEINTKPCLAKGAVSWLTSGLGTSVKLEKVRLTFSSYANNIIKCDLLITVKGIDHRDFVSTADFV